MGPLSRGVFGPIKADLAAIDSLETLVSLDQDTPSLLDNAAREPFFETVRAGLVRGESFGHYPPGNSRHQDIQNTVQALAIAAGLAAIADPHDRGQQRLEHSPDFVGQLAGNVF
jgi:hypothetical protein